MNASPQGGSEYSGPKLTPWTVRFRDTAGYDCMSGGYEIRDATGAIVVSVDVYDYVPRDSSYEVKTAPNAEVEAVANLIAHAPDVLRALAVLFVSVGFERLNIPDEINPEAAEHVDRVVMAVAQAREALRKSGYVVTGTDERSEEAT